MSSEREKNDGGAVAIVCDWIGANPFPIFIEAEVDGKSISFEWRDRDDGLKELIIPRPAQPAAGVPEMWQPMESAPRDGTMVRLLVDFAEHATEDSPDPCPTIGANNDDNVGLDEGVGWQFAGWCWDHDHFTEGKGMPIGWLPMRATAQQPAPPAAGVPDRTECLDCSYNPGCCDTHDAPQPGEAAQDDDAIDPFVMVERAVTNLPPGFAFADAQEHAARPTQPLEQRAREILADEYERRGCWAVANGLRVLSSPVAFDYETAIQAIVRALQESRHE